MKKLIIALVLLIIAGLICATEFVFISNTVDDYSEKIDRLENLMYEGKITQALDYCKDLNDDWYKVSGRIDTLLYHDYIDNISILLKSLPDYIEYGDYGTMHATCKQAKKLLMSLKESEYPILQNII